MTAKVGLIFSAMPSEVPTWPYIGYDYEARASMLSEALRKALPQVEFKEALVKNVEEAKKALENMNDVVGFVVYLIGIWNNVPWYVISEKKKPTILVDDLYGGTGEFLLTLARARKENYNVVGVASSNFNDVVEKVKLLETLDNLKKLKILLVRDSFPKWYEDYAEALEKTFGSKVVKVSVEELLEEYKKVNEEEAEGVAEAWVASAQFVEPKKEEIVKSAKMYIAMKNLLEKYDAKGITIDCLGLFYSNKLPAYPCLGYVQLLNDGFIATCEADLDSSITQAVIEFATGRPGFVSDPVIDQAKNQIIYAHCLAATKVYGKERGSTLYKIRTHAEDRKGAALQALWPLGEQITTIKFNVMQKAMSLHSGKIVENVEEEKACRTKVAAEANVNLILNNWNREADFGWHRVSVVGNFREKFVDIARLLGFRVIEEDR
ncbi:MAG: L-arabinose isomerase family protein [Thermoproteota archaeon]